MTRARLLTVPFSHYCEKARWGLDRAGIDYVEEGHVPGFHRIAVKRAGSKSTSVPVLVADGRTLGDSTDILAWADEKASGDKRLYPTGEAERREVLALEDRLDTELGPHLRRVLYFYILGVPRLAFGLMDQETPFWQRAALRVTSPLLFAGMRRFMRITPEGASQSHAAVLRVFDDMEARLADGRAFLVGDHFTAADLTLAALAAPAVRPEEHPSRFPPIEELSPAAATLLNDLEPRPIAAYVRRMYRDHRRAPA